MKSVAVLSFGVFAVLTLAATARGEGPPARTFDSGGRAIVTVNGFAMLETSSDDAKPSRPLVGAVLLILGKDKPGGNVQLFWSGGAPPYTVTRNGTITVPCDPNLTTCDDHVLFDGLGETWGVN